MTFFNSVFGMSYVILMPVFARDILSCRLPGFRLSAERRRRRRPLRSLAGRLLEPLPAAKAYRRSTARWFSVSPLIVFAYSNSFPLSLALAPCPRHGQPVLHDDDPRHPANEPTRRIARARHGHSWIGLGAHACRRHDRRRHRRIASAPTAVAFGGVMVGGMAFVVAVTMPTIRRLQQ